MAGPLVLAVISVLSCTRVKPRALRNVLGDVGCVHRVGAASIEGEVSVTNLNSGDKRFAACQWF